MSPTRDGDVGTSQQHSREADWGSRQIIIAALSTAVAYYLGARVGLSLTLPSDAASVLWPPNAIVLAALLIAPTRVWWIIIASVLPVHLFVELQGGVPITMVLCWFVSNCLEALIGAGIMRRWSPGGGRLDSVRALGIFVLGATFLGTFVSTFADAGFVVLNGWKEVDYWEIWRTRFFSNVLATQTIVPVILACTPSLFVTRPRAPIARYVEGALLGALTLAVCIGAFVQPSPPWHLGPSMLYAPLPLLLWAALRFGWTGVNISLVAVSYFAIRGAVHGGGPFIGLEPSQNALSLQTYLILVAAPLQLLVMLIEERDGAEIRARDRQRLLALTLKSARVGVWDIDLATGRTTLDEQLAAMVDLPNWERRDVSSWLMRMHPSDRVEIEAVLHEAQAQDAPRDESGDSPIAESVSRVLHRDISWHWILSRGIVLRRPDGTPYRATGIGVDVTERRRIGDAIRESEERMELAASTADLGFWSIDVASGDIWLSDHCATLLGVAGGTDRTGQVVDLLLGGAAPLERKAQAAESASAPLIAHEVRVVLPGGEERWVATSARRVHEESGASDRIIGVVRDVTERRERDADLAERQQVLAHLARVAMMGELSATVVHELGQPIGAVTLNAETARLLIRRQASDEQRVVTLPVLLDDIVRDSRRAETVINQLRRLMRREQIEREDANLAGVVDEVLDLVRAELVKHEIELELDVGDEPAHVVVNRAQMHQVLLNIILNARDAMESVPADSRRLRISLQCEREYDRAHLIIADSGKGIEAARIHEVFEPFVTSKAHGVGLGLAISRSIMMDHGGDLRAESSDGGAVLHLELPLAPSVRAPEVELADVIRRSPERYATPGRFDSDFPAAP